MVLVTSVGYTDLAGAGGGEDRHLLLLPERRAVADLGLGLDLESVLLTRRKVADGALILVRVELGRVLWDEGLVGERLGAPVDGEAGDDAVGGDVGQVPLERDQVW